jgi:hypothetical protein
LKNSLKNKLNSLKNKLNEIISYLSPIGRIGLNFCIFLIRSWFFFKTHIGTPNFIFDLFDFVKRSWDYFLENTDQKIHQGLYLYFNSLVAKFKKCLDFRFYKDPQNIANFFKSLILLILFFVYIILFFINEIIDSHLDALDALYKLVIVNPFNEIFWFIEDLFLFYSINGLPPLLSESITLINHFLNRLHKSLLKLKNSFIDLLLSIIKIILIIGATTNKIIDFIFYIIKLPFICLNKIAHFLFDILFPEKEKEKVSNPSTLDSLLDFLKTSLKFHLRIFLILVFILKSLADAASALYLYLVFLKNRFKYNCMIFMSRQRTRINALYFVYFTFRRRYIKYVANKQLDAYLDYFLGDHLLENILSALIFCIIFYVIQTVSMEIFDFPLFIDLNIPYEDKIFLKILYPSLKLSAAFTIFVLYHCLYFNLKYNFEYLISAYRYYIYFDYYKYPPGYDRLVKNYTYIADIIPIPIYSSDNYWLGWYKSWSTETKGRVICNLVLFWYSLIKFDAFLHSFPPWEPRFLDLYLYLIADCGLFLLIMLLVIITISVVIPPSKFPRLVMFVRFILMLVILVLIILLIIIELFLA